MKRWLAVTLGILTAIGGFVDIGDLVANSETGARFGMRLAPVVVVGVVGICVYAEMCGRVADRAVQIHGGAGYMADYGIERFYRDVRLFRIYEGTSQIQQLVIARNMIKAAGES